MAAKPSFKVSDGETFGFIQKATPKQLLEIAGGTALRADPLVANFKEEQAEDLRTRIAKNFRRHADFRGMVVRAVDRIQPRKEPEPAVSSGAPKGGEGGKPKKVKAPKESKKKSE
jgi:hypothetical protein